MSLAGALRGRRRNILDLTLADDQCAPHDSSPLFSRRLRMLRCPRSLTQI